MARKGAQRSDPGRRLGSPAAAVVTAHASPSLETGFALALVLAILYVHAQLTATNGRYTSFCNVSTRVNCDAVLSSAYGRLLGVSVAVWALLTYAALALLLFVRRRATG